MSQLQERPASTSAGGGSLDVLVVDDQEIICELIAEHLNADGHQSVTMSDSMEALDRFAKAIERWPEVLECYLMTGSRDYWLRVVVPDLDAYERFVKQKLTRIEGIASIESSFALQQVKYTNVLPVA